MVYGAAFSIVLAKESPPLEQTDSEKKQSSRNALGRSCETAIVLEIEDIDKVEQWIAEYAKRNFPEYRIIGVGSYTDLMQTGKTFEVISLKKNDSTPQDKDRTVRLYFDITVASKHYGKTHKKEIGKALKESRKR